MNKKLVLQHENPDSTDAKNKEKPNFLLRQKIKFNPLRSNIIILFPILFLLIVVSIFIIVFSFPEYTECFGVIEPSNYYSVYSQAAGVIDSSNFIEGSMVKENDLLIRFDTTELSISCRRIKKSIDGTNIKINSLKASISLKKKENKIIKDKYENDMYDLVDMVRNNIVSEKKLTDMMHEYKKFRNDMEITINNLEYSLEESRNVMDQLKLDLIATENALKLLEIYSPYKGRLVLPDFLAMNNYDVQNVNYLSQKPVKGRVLQKGSLIGYIISDKKYIAKIKIPEKDMDKIEVGQKVKIYLSTYDYMEYDFLEGQVSNVSTTAYLGYFIGVVDITSEIKSDIVDMKKVVGTSLKAKIELKNRNLISRLLGD